ncbi:MAG: hypothetical protein AB1437_01760 [Pseudomonadota bacterium]
MNKQVYWMPLAMAAFVAADAGAGAVSATDSRYMAPPGLYEVHIQSDRTTRSPDGRSMREQIDVGVEGDHKVRYSNSEGRTGSYGLAGDKPHRSCVPAAKPGAIPAQMLAGGCVGKPGVVKGDRMVSEASCPWGKMTFSARRVDAKTWENTIDEERNGSVAGAGNMRSNVAPLKAMLEQAAKTGNAKERAEAREALAGIDRQIKESEAARADLPDLPEAAAGAGSPRITKTVIRMTRIADSCK